MQCNGWDESLRERWNPPTPHAGVVASAEGHPGGNNATNIPTTVEECAHDSSMRREGDFVDEKGNRVAEPGRRHAEEKASEDEGNLILRRSLQYHTKNEEGISNKDTQLAAIFVRDPRGDWV